MTLALTQIAVLLVSTLSASAAQKLLVISVDGLDNRYLQDRDRLGLKIPRLRKLVAEGQVANGVIGVVPTVTWPSHTTLITGVDPAVHGIRGNRRPASEGGDYYWSAKLLKTKTLLDLARAAGRKTATVTWPVTVDAPVDFNLPEYFQRRRGGAMDLRSIAEKSTPADLVERISRMFPSFAQEWMDDRTRTQAVVYLLKTEKPDLILLHLVDLDSEQHDNTPFSSEAKAILEYTDELIGQMLDAMPKDYAVAVVSDHGFERVERTASLKELASLRGGLAVTETPEATARLKKLSADPQSGIGRQIPKEELLRFAPEMKTVDAAFEPAEGVQFTAADAQAKPRPTGNHGHWPTRYRAVYALWGPGIKRQQLPEISMKDIAAKLASVIGVPNPAP